MFNFPLKRQLWLDLIIFLISSWISTQQFYLPNQLITFNCQEYVNRHEKIMQRPLKIFLTSYSCLFDKSGIIIVNDIYCKLHKLYALWKWFCPSGPTLFYKRCIQLVRFPNNISNCKFFTDVGTLPWGFVLCAKMLQSLKCSGPVKAIKIV